MTPNTLKGFIAVITVLVLGTSAFSFTQPSAPASLVSKAQFDPLPEPVQTRVAQASSPREEAVQIINLTFNNELLSDVLQRIAEKTNISFRITSGLLSQRISARIQASSWEEGVQELLKDMNQLSVWDENSQLTHVVILGGKNFASNPEQTAPSIQGRRVSSRRASRANGDNQTFLGSTVAQADNRGKPSEANLRKLLRIQPGKELPGELFNDPELNQFLQANRIQSPKDWKKFHKARTVRKSVRRELRQILAKK